MTTTIQNLSDLQDRRIMMDKKLPPYGYAFVILTGLFMIFLVIWSTQTNRIYVSQNSGVVQAANKTYIMSSYSGSITELYVSEGSYVNEGDLIARLKSTDLDMQKDNLQSQLDIYQKQLDQYNKLLKCIQDDTNYFDETNADDQPYYYQYQTYKSQVSQKTFDATTYQAAGYSDTQIKALMEQNQSELESLYYSTMQSISQSITSAQVNVDNLQAQLDSLNTGANDYYIYAPTSGVIHMDTPYKEGMVLSAGSALATVASENDDLEIMAMVTVNDRPLLHVGDPCKIAITGLSEYSYGTLTGTVTSIDSDVTASSSASYYKMTIKPDATYVVSRSGDKVDLSNGMSVTARVEYDQVTYFEYAMEALGGYHQAAGGGNGGFAGGYAGHAAKAVYCGDLLVRGGQGDGGVVGGGGGAHLQGSRHRVAHIDGVGGEGKVHLGHDHGGVHRHHDGVGADLVAGGCCNGGGANAHSLYHAAAAYSKHAAVIGQKDHSVGAVTGLDHGGQLLGSAQQHIGRVAAGGNALGGHILEPRQ